MPSSFRIAFLLERDMSLDMTKLLNIRFGTSKKTVRPTRGKDSDADHGYSGLGPKGIREKAFGNPEGWSRGQWLVKTRESYSKSSNLP